MDDRLPPPPQRLRVTIEIQQKFSQWEWNIMETREIILDAPAASDTGRSRAHGGTAASGRWGGAHAHPEKETTLPPPPPHTHTHTPTHRNAPPRADNKSNFPPTAAAAAAAARVLWVGVPLLFLIFLCPTLFVAFFFVSPSGIYLCNLSGRCDARDYSCDDPNIHLLFVSPSIIRYNY